MSSRKPGLKLGEINPDKAEKRSENQEEMASVGSPKRTPTE